MGGDALRLGAVTASLAESGSLPPGLWLRSQCGLTAEVRDQLRTPRSFIWDLPLLHPECRNLSGGTSQKNFYFNCFARNIVLSPLSK